MKTICFGLACLLLGFGAPLNLLLATDYYVSGSGDDANDGLSSATAFRTLTRALAEIDGDDRILVEAGTYDAAAGEAFPLGLSVPVQILGPGDGTAVIDRSGATGTIFGLGNIGNTTVISGLTLEASGADGTGVRVVGVVADLQILDNVINAGTYGVRNTTSDSGLLTVSGNTIADNSTLTASAAPPTARSGAPLGADGGGRGPRGGGPPPFDAISWNVGSAAGVALQISGNTLTGGGGSANGVDLDVGTNATIDLNVSGNMITDFGNRGIQIDVLSAFNGANTVFDFALQGNTITGCNNEAVDLDLSQLAASALACAMNVNNNTIQSNGAGGGAAAFAVYGFASGDPGVLGMNMNFAGNDISNNSVAGVEFNWYAENTGAQISIEGVFECNTIAGNAGTGLELYLTNDTGTKGSAVLYRYNAITGNGGRGFSAVIENSDQLALTWTPVLYANTVTGNTGDGVLVSTQWDSVGAPTHVVAPDFGGGGGAPGNIGRNDFSGNGGFAFALMATDSMPTISAQGNWWGTDSPESVIFHQPDMAGDGVVDFSNFLSDTLEFSVLDAAPGGLTSATADSSGTAFVAKSGDLGVSVTVEGQPATDIEVASDGTSITFRVPFIPTEGTIGPLVPVMIQNPGGSSGTAMMELVSSAGLVTASSCFLATATFGDADAPEVELLRRWRDEHLAPNPLGRALVRAYYAVSPPLAEALSESRAARGAARLALAPVIGGVRLWMESPWAFAGAAALLGFALRRRRR